MRQVTAEPHPETAATRQAKAELRPETAAMPQGMAERHPATAAASTRSLATDIKMREPLCELAQ